MDCVVDVKFAIEMSKLGGLAVLNLEGVQTRYKNPQEVLQKVVDTDKSEITALLQKIYLEPVQEDLIAARVKQMKDAGAIAAVACALVNHALLAQMLRLARGKTYRESGLFTFGSLSTEVVLAASASPDAASSA